MWRQKHRINVIKPYWNIVIYQLLKGYIDKSNNLRKIRIDKYNLQWKQLKKIGITKIRNS